MKIQLLMAVSDTDYVEHLSRAVLERYGDTFAVSVCSTGQRLREMTADHRYDVALFSADLAEETGLENIRLALLLWAGGAPAGEQGQHMKMLRKYQRISALVSQVLEEYAQVHDGQDAFSDGETRFTVVWSPAGGSGKTTAALAYAAQAVSRGKRALYLDLETFSSVDAYFDGAGKGISAVFEKLDSGDGSLELLLQSIRREDSGSGICYFCKPDNYDDINILSREDLTNLLKGCAKGMDEVVVDLSGTYDERTRFLMEYADQVLAVVDPSAACQVKWRQFKTQNDLYEALRPKLTLVANRNARQDPAEAERLITLPVVQSADPVVVYKTLTAGYFKL